MKKIIVLALSIIMLLSVGCSAAVSVVGANINEDGHLVLSMSDGSTIDAGYARGEDGMDGKDGVDGKDGRDGIDGVDGVSIKKAAVNDSGHLMIRLTDDTLIDTGYVIGADGKDGRDGIDGRDGRDGADGRDGVDGTDGSNGIDGKTPYIGNNGNWWIGDEDTGISARGNDGITPHIGDNGNWFIGEEDTGIYAGKEFPDGTFFTVTYDVGEGTLPDGTVTSVTVEALDTLDSMPSPTAPANKYFVGWYNGDVLVNVFTPIDGNMTLIAKYAANGSSVDGLIIVDNELVGYTGTEATIVIPDGVTVICDGAFKGNTKIKKVTIPNSVKAIGTRAFYGCSSLENINIPEGITRIEEYTFYNCSKLSTFTFPSTLKYIGQYAFYGTGIKNIVLNEGLTEMGQYAFASSKAIALSLPTTLKTVPQYAFYNSLKLATINWSEGLEHIGNYAFSRYVSSYSDGCSSLSGAMVFPDSLKTIGDYAFVYHQFTSVIFKGNLASIGKGAFKQLHVYSYNYSTLTNVQFVGNNVLQTIGDDAFDGTKITSIYLPESLTYFGRNFATSSSAPLAIYCAAKTPPAMGYVTASSSKQFGILYYVYESSRTIFYDRTFKLYVPADSISEYESAKLWSKASAIEAYDFGE